MRTNDLDTILAVAVLFGAAVGFGFWMHSIGAGVFAFCGPLSVRLWGFK